MTAELKPCPFCGGKAKIIQSSRRTLFFTACEDCDADSDYYDTEEKAAEAWNRRTERTCQNTGDRDLANDKYYDFKCSACGFECSAADAKFCPHCGAKVVE